MDSTRPPTLFFSNTSADHLVPGMGHITYNRSHQGQKVAWAEDVAGHRMGSKLSDITNLPQEVTWGRPTSQLMQELPEAESISGRGAKAAELHQSVAPPSSAPAPLLVKSTPKKNDKLAKKSSALFMSSNPLPSVRRMASRDEMAVTAAMQVLRHQPPSLPIIRALMRYTSYGPQIDALQEQLSKKKSAPSLAKKGKKVSGALTVPKKGPSSASSLRPATATVKRQPVGKVSGRRDPVNSPHASSEEERLISALNQHYGSGAPSAVKPGGGLRSKPSGAQSAANGEEVGRNPSFHDDSARRQLEGEEDTSIATDRPINPQPSLGSTLPKGNARAVDPGLVFSRKQSQKNASPLSAGGAEALQRQMAQMAEAMAGSGPGAAVAGLGGAGGGGGFGATSVVLWEVMSLVLMRSVLSSAVGAMSSQMTGIAQQVGMVMYECEACLRMKPI